MWKRPCALHSVLWGALQKKCTIHLSCYKWSSILTAAKYLHKKCCYIRIFNIHVCKVSCSLYSIAHVRFIPSLKWFKTHQCFINTTYVRTQIDARLLNWWSKWTLRLIAVKFSNWFSFSLYSNLCEIWIRFQIQIDVHVSIFVFVLNH